MPPRVIVELGGLVEAEGEVVVWADPLGGVDRAGLERRLDLAAGQVLNDIASGDPLSREVFDSTLRFRKDAIGWSKMSEQTYLAARALPFKYAQPSSG